MSAKFNTDLEGFKRMVATLGKAITDGLPDDAIEAGFKCVTIHYFYFDGSPADIIIVRSYFNWAARRYLDYSVRQELAAQ